MNLDELERRLSEAEVDDSAVTSYESQLVYRLIDLARDVEQMVGENFDSLTVERRLNRAWRVACNGETTAIDALAARTVREPAIVAAEKPRSLLGKVEDFLIEFGKLSAE